MSFWKRKPTRVVRLTPHVGMIIKFGDRGDTEYVVTKVIQGSDRLSIFTEAVESYTKKITPTVGVKVDSQECYDGMHNLCRSKTCVCVCH